MSKYFFLLITAFQITAFAEQNVESRVYSSFTNSFKLASISAKETPDGYNVLPDPNCKWPEGPICQDIQVPYGSKKVVQVLMDYSVSSFPHNYEDGFESVSFNLKTDLFTDEELSLIRKAKGHKATKLVNQLFTLNLEKVKIPVTEPIYGKCDTEQNCQIIGEETVLRT